MAENEESIELPSVQWTKLIGTSKDDRGYSIIKGLDDSIHISGVTYGNLNNESME